VSRPTVVSTRGLAKCFQALDDRCEVVLLVPSACQRLNDIARLQPPIPETFCPMPRDFALDEFPKDFGDRAVADSCPEVGPQIVCHCDTSHPIAPGGRRFGCRRSLDSLSASSSHPRFRGIVYM